MEGVWVAEQAKECPPLPTDEHMNTVGEGALLIRGTKYYSHESLCRIATSAVRGSELFIGGYDCGTQKGEVTLFLHVDKERSFLVEIVKTGSNVFGRTYLKKCSF
jgi:hypothetical protein